MPLDVLGKSNEAILDCFLFKQRRITWIIWLASRRQAMFLGFIEERRRKGVTIYEQTVMADSGFGVRYALGIA